MELKSSLFVIALRLSVLMDSDALLAADAMRRRLGLLGRLLLVICICSRPLRSMMLLPSPKNIV